MNKETKEKIRKSLLGRKQSQETIKKRIESRKGYKHSEETKRKIMESHRGKVHSEETKNKLRENHVGMLGKHHSKETKEKLRKNNSHYWKGKHFSEETKKKISMSNKGRISPHKGKHFSEETKKKISLGNKGKIVSIESRKKMRLATFEYAKKIANIICPRIGHNEKQILDKLEQELQYKILRQYKIEGYFVDGYIPELNLAIEVDEIPKDKEKDIKRQKIIEEKLNCKFIRIKDFD
jgi:very-short-patch-repair endonuclease